MNINTNKLAAYLISTLSLVVLLVINFSVEYSPVVHFIVLPLILVAVLVMVTKHFKCK